MAFTIKTSFRAFWLLLLICASQVLAAPAGLNTRDQNPMFQAYYLPSIDLPGIYLKGHQGWHVSHSVYLTSVFLKTSQGNETLILDGENYRYDFSIAYQQEKWRLAAAVPFIFNEAGSFDAAIEGWHDFFGMPQGGRLSRPRNQLDIIDTKNGQTLFSQTQATNDIRPIRRSYGLY